jgi:translation initiation factor 2 alpha subunit (eIF-2alpha)
MMTCAYQELVFSHGINVPLIIKKHQKTKSFKRVAHQKWIQEVRDYFANDKRGTLKVIKVDKK